MANAKTSLNGSNKNISVEDLSAQIEILKNDLSGLTSALQEFGVSKTQQATQTAKEKAAHLQQAGQEKAAEAQLRAEDFVRTQPATALGLAAGLGFLVGLITTQRR